LGESELFENGKRKYTCQVVSQRATLLSVEIQEFQEILFKN
jgi:CRP-like cAMP-binding protein